MTITGLSAADKEYDGATAATVLGDLALNDTIGGDAVTVDVSAGEANFDNKDAGTNKDVFFTGYALTGADAGNYNLTQPATVKADITLYRFKDADVVRDLAAVYYNGLPQGVGLPALEGDLVDGKGEITVRYNGYETLPVNTGSYEVTVDIRSLEQANYADTAGLVLGAFEILPAAPLLLTHLTFAMPDSVVYNRLPQAVAAQVLNDHPYTGMGVMTVLYDGDPNVPIDAGDYEVTVGIAAGGNFAPAVLTLGVYVIAQAATMPEYLAFELPEAVVYYDGMPYAALATVTDAYAAGMGDVTVKYNGSPNVPVAPGVYIVRLDGRSYKVTLH